MKNFRKSIIALATAAAMLIPSVAMAATITATVEDKAVSGNVYAGFYKGDVLVKAELGGTTEVKTETTSSGSTEEAELTQPAVSAKVVTVDGGVKKLVFTATPDADMGVIAAASAIFSYDSTVVVPEKNAFKFFTDKYASNTLSTNSSVATYADGDRVVVKAEGAVAGGAEFALPADGVNVIEFSFTVADGKEITADTFKIEDDYDANPVLAQVYGDRTSSTAAGLFVGTSSDYVRYGAWDNGADTLTWKGFEIVEDVEPTTKPVVSVTDDFVGVSAAGNVHKLTFSVDAATTTAVSTASINISIDTNDVSLVVPASGSKAAFGNAGAQKAAIRNASNVCGAWVCENGDGGLVPMTKDTTVGGSLDGTTGIYTATLAAKFPTGDALSAVETYCYCTEDFALDITDETVFAEIYYVANENAKVDADTFKFNSGAFGTITDVTFAGFPWKAAEVTTTTKTVITVNDVVAPADYDSIKVFVWDAKQIAQCAPVAGTLN